MNAINEFRFQSPSILFGMGTLAKAGETVQKMGCKNAMIVTDGFLASCGVADQLKASLDGSGIGSTLYSKVSPSPTQGEAVDCFRMLQQSGCDIVIGLGGGSPMDVAKGAALLMNNPEPLDQYVGVDKVQGALMPLIAIPTTSGTGSETSNAAILKNEETGIKAGIISTKMIPAAAIVDPELTLSMPPRLTAASGMDALTHAIECYTGLKATPVTRLFHREAIGLIAGNLRLAVGCGADRQARYNMALGAMYAGIGMAMSGCAAVHALAYPLEGAFRVTHGEANASLLAETMRFNALGNLDLFCELTDILGGGTQNLAKREKALRSAEMVAQLSEDIAIPRLGSIGVTAGDIPGLAAKALEVKRLIDNNPRAITQQDAAAIYTAAM